MNNWKKYALATVIVTVAGFAYIKSLHRNIPSDLRDAVADETSPEFNSLHNVKASDIKPVSEVPVPVVSKGYVVENDPSAGVPATPIEWVTIPGGKFTMGTDDGEEGFEDAKPIHEVAIKTFEMSKTVVTVEQYAECVIKGKCTKPDIWCDGCNWYETDRQLHPVNCVDWDQANQYAKFKGARLPSESEWEYAATSGGKNQKYPWGNEAPTCDKAVMFDHYEGYGCGHNGTMPVCSKIYGNTAQGLCDMAGNVWQWVQDMYHNSYIGAPADGSAVEGAGSFRVLRGGSFSLMDASNLRADSRYLEHPGDHYNDFGFRLARSSR